MAQLTWDRREYRLDASYRTSAQFALGLSAAYLDLAATNTSGIPAMNSGVTYGNRGIDDTSLQAAWTPWETAEPHEDSFLSSHHLSVLLGVKLPTGNERQGPFPVLFYTRVGNGFPVMTTGIAYRAPVGAGVRVFGLAQMDTPLASSTSQYRAGNQYSAKIGAAYGFLQRMDLRASSVHADARQVAVS